MSTPAPRLKRKLTLRELEALPPGLYGTAKTGYELLRFIVRPGGRRHWEYAYRWPRGKTGGPNRSARFPFPDTTIDEVRLAVAEIRKLVREGVEPGSKNTPLGEAGRSFREVAIECYRARKVKDFDNVMYGLEKHAFPVFGDKPIGSITREDMMRCLDAIKAQGIHEQLHRVRTSCGVVFKYGAARGGCTVNYAALLASAYERPKSTQRKMLGKADMPDFLVKLDSYDQGLGTVVVKLAFKLMMLTASRSKNALEAKWEHFVDLDGKEPTWQRPAEAMKSGRAHNVALSKQATQTMIAMREYTLARGMKCDGFVFPKQVRGDEDFSAHISNGAFTALVEALGYRGKVDPHGFRSTFRTMVAEARRFNREECEACLDHVVGNAVERTYQRHKYEAEQREIFQWYADELDRLQSSATF